MFGIGATAFGMTLRPEPMIALLVVAVLACCIRYLQASAAGPLVVAMLLVGLALTIHPAGAVALAPLFVCLPRVIGDARRRSGITVVELALAVSVGTAWTTLLAVLDFDLTSRDESIGLIQDAGHSSGLVQESERYEALWQWGASPPRRELVALLVVSAAIALVAWRRKRDLLERLPSASVAIGLLLLRICPQQMDLALRRVHGARCRGHWPRVRPIRPGPRLGALAVGGRGRWCSRSLSSRPRTSRRGVPLDGSGVNWDAIPFLALTGATALVALLLARLRASRTSAALRRSSWSPSPSR